VTDTQLLSGAHLTVRGIEVAAVWLWAMNRARKRGIRN